MNTSLPFSSSDATHAFDRHLYISSEKDLAFPILCYDSVLCYLSNVLGQSSLYEIETNVQRYFSREQCEQAYCQLHNCLDYVLAKPDGQSDAHVHDLLQQCSLNLIDAASLLSTMETIHINGLAAYLPCFVTDDWLNMIRHVQNLEQLDTKSSLSSMTSIQQQMDQLKEQLTHLHRRSSATPHASSTTKDQCCLRTCCSHDPTGMSRSATLINSPSSSSWSSLDTDFQPITPHTGFIRNAVTNFLIPTAPARSEMDASLISLDDNNVSSDEEIEFRSSPTSSPFLNRSLSYQPSTPRTGPVLVKRHDVLWIYPAATIKPKNHALFSSVHEEQHDFKPVFARANSCDVNFPEEKPPSRAAKKSTKPPKGSHQD